MTQQKLAVHKPHCGRNGTMGMEKGILF